MSMLDELKLIVYKANLDMVSNGLVILTWGNVSGKDISSGLIVIKPSGVKYERMKPEDMVVVDPDGKVIEGKNRPSTDTPTHLILYNKYPEIGGIVHTHSTYATSWAQVGKAIPPFGTTHADHFYGAVPVSRILTRKEINDDYKANTGKVIIETLQDASPLTMPSKLLNCHGPF
jgi:L-ribulose-5-phosphate 4-epimerase